MATVTLLIYVPLQWYVVLNWRGGWRIAALAPLLFMIPAFAVCLHGCVQDSNLAPMFLVVLAPFAAAYLLALAAVRRAKMRRRSELAPA